LIGERDLVVVVEVPRSRRVKAAAKTNWATMEGRSAPCSDIKTGNLRFKFGVWIVIGRDGLDGSKWKCASVEERENRGKNPQGHDDGASSVADQKPIAHEGWHSRGLDIDANAKGARHKIEEGLAAPLYP
jgi:hypothetical protein